MSKVSFIILIFVSVKIIKRWSEAESFTIFENHVYTSKKNLIFAINFVATPFLRG